MDEEVQHHSVGRVGVVEDDGCARGCLVVPEDA